MNQKPKTIEDVLKELGKEKIATFGQKERLEDFPDLMEKIRTSFSDLLDEIVPEKLENDGGIASQDPSIAWDDGWNACRQAILEKVKELNKTDEQRNKN